MKRLVLASLVVAFLPSLALAGHGHSSYGFSFGFSSGGYYPSYGYAYSYYPRYYYAPAYVAPPAYYYAPPVVVAPPPVVVTPPYRYYDYGPRTYFRYDYYRDGYRGHSHGRGGRYYYR